LWGRLCILTNEETSLDLAKEKSHRIHHSIVIFPDRIGPPPRIESKIVILVYIFALQSDYVLVIPNSMAFSLGSPKKRIRLNFFVPMLAPVLLGIAVA